MSTLYPYQVEGVLRFLRTPDKRLFYVLDPGLGKTAMAVDTARRLDAKRVLVVTLAVLRGQWQREFDVFWPDHPPLGLVTAGRERKIQTKKQRAAYDAPYQIVSYTLLKHIDPVGWDLIILDELQRVAHSWAAQSKLARAFLADTQTPALGLTGTPIPRDVTDLWHPLHIFFKRFWHKPNKNGRGSYAFNRHFSNLTEGPYSASFSGLREENLPELKERLARHMYVVKRADVTGLPSITFSILPVPVPRAPVLRGESEYAKLALQKVEHIKEWLELHSEETHKALLVWFRNTATSLASELKDYGPVYVVTGDVLPEKRLQIRDKFQETGGVLVFNMAAFGVGVNLGFVTRALFCELYGKPEIFVQAMMRFPRVNSTAPCLINALVAEGTPDEFVAEKLVSRVADTNKALGAGGVEDQIIAGFSAEANELSDDEFMRMALGLGTRDLEDTDD